MNSLPGLHRAGIPESWDAAVTQLVEAVKDPLRASRGPLVVLVCGAKGVGKSTCARYVTNRLVSALPTSGSPEDGGIVEGGADIGDKDGATAARHGGDGRDRVMFLGEI